MATGRISRSTKLRGFRISVSSSVRPSVWQRRPLAWLVLPWRWLAPPSMSGTWQGNECDLFVPEARRARMADCPASDADDERRGDRRRGDPHRADEVRAGLPAGPPQRQPRAPGRTGEYSSGPLASPRERRRRLHGGPRPAAGSWIFEEINDGTAVVSMEFLTMLGPPKIGLLAEERASTPPTSGSWSGSAIRPVACRRCGRRSSRTARPGPGTRFVDRHEARPGWQEVLAAARAGKVVTRWANTSRPTRCTS